MNRSAKIDAFIAEGHWAGAERRLVAGDASNRRYERLTRPDGGTAILMDAPPEKGEDVRPFIHIATYLCDQGLSAPEILETNIDQGLLIIEDLGDDLFATLLAADPSLDRQLYTAATEALIHLHAAPKLDLPLCDARWMAQMNRLIFDWYAPDLPAQDQATFEALFHPLAQSLDSDERVVILRDYHAQNLLWLPGREGVGRVGQLDFQDALLGHRAYDLVSILQDARRDVDPALERDMIDLYIARTGQPRKEFERAYAILGAQRNLCILGIFARLCLRDGKPLYLDLLPRVWDLVQRDLAHPDLKPLKDFLKPRLPAPSTSFIANLRSKCAPSPS